MALSTSNTGFILHVGHHVGTRRLIPLGATIPAGLPKAGTRETELTSVVAKEAALELRRLGHFSLHFPFEVGLVLPKSRVDLADCLHAADLWRRNSGLKHVVFLSLHYDAEKGRFSDSGVLYLRDATEPGITVAGELVQSCPDVPIHLRFDTGLGWPVGPAPKSVAPLYLSLGCISSEVHPAGKRNLHETGRWLGRALADSVQWLM